MARLSGVPGDLQDQLEFETLISDLSALLITAPDADFEATIEAALGVTALFFGGERGAIIEIPGGGGKAVLLSAWYAPAAKERVPDNLDLAPHTPWAFHEVVEERRPLVVQSLQELPPEAAVDGARWSAMGLRSKVVVPIVIGHAVAYVINIDSLTRELLWHPSYLPRLQLLGEVLANAIERRRVSEALRQSEARLASAVNVARLGFYQVADGERATFVDARCRHLFGMSEDEAQGARALEHWAVHLHPDDCRSLLDLQEQLNDGRTDRAVVTYRYLHPERGLIWIHQVTDIIQRYESGKARTTIGVVRDVTEDKWREEALRASEEINRATFEQAAVGIAHVAADGTWLRVNDKVCDILGYSREELIGRKLQDVTHPDDVAMSLDYIDRVLGGRIGSYSLEKRYVRKDGSTIWAMLTVSLARDAAGQPKHFISIIEDVTPRKQAEETLAKAHAELQRLREQLEHENIYLRQETKALKGPRGIVGQSQAIRMALMDVEKVAPTLSTVLLLGETGTGKERFAEAIHQLSPRRDRTMIRVNCAAIPVTLIESELFGRERGAYTGALSKQVGRFELANGSTIFLDEIGDLPIDIQVKLLRVLQERQIERLGSPRPVPVDVRIIVATNHDLERDVREGRFREDLYYRVNVFPVRVPPLRDRPGDIPLLVESLVEEFAGTMGKRVESVSRASMDALLRYGWPGNVRELRNAVERAMILATGPVLEIAVPGASRPPQPAQSRLATGDAEREALLKVLEQAHWRIRGKDGAAEILGLKPTTLESRMARLGITRP